MRTNSYQNHRVAKAAKAAKIAKAAASKAARNYHAMVANSVAWAFCTFAIIYQSYRVVDQYLRYETTSQVEIFNPEYLSVPDIFIGFSGSELAQANHTRDEDLYYSDRFYYDFYYSPTVEDAIVRCKTGQANSVLPKSCPSNQMQKSSKNGHVYYSAGVDLTELFPKIWTWNGDALYFMQFSEQFRNISDVKVTLQAPLQDPFGFDLTVFDYQSSDPEFLAIEFYYTHLEQHLLPAPYDSNCFDYQNIGFSSQGHCVEHCLNAGYLANMNKTNGRSFWAERDLVNRRRRALTWFNCTGDSADEEAFQMECESELQYSCSQNCSRPDCFKEIFVPIEENYERSRDWQIRLYPPKLQSQRTRRIPRTDIINCLSELLGIFGFWIGFSPYTLIDLVLPNIVFVTVKSTRKSKMMLAIEAKARENMRITTAKRVAYGDRIMALYDESRRATAEKRWIYDSSIPSVKRQWGQRHYTI